MGRLKESWVCPWTLATSHKQTMTANPSTYLPCIMASLIGMEAWLLGS